jgi:hypothetical protein
MPANQGSGNPNWNPQPDLNPGYDFLDVQPLTSFVPASAIECSRFIIDQCSLPDVAVYSGMPDEQRSVADCITARVYEEGKDVLPSLQHYLEERHAEEQAVIAARRAEVYPASQEPAEPEPMATVYVVTKQHIGQMATSPRGHLRKSRVSA